MLPVRKYVPGLAFSPKIGKLLHIKLQRDLHRTDTFLSLIVSKRIMLATTYYTENVEDVWEIIYLYSGC